MRYLSNNQIIMYGSLLEAKLPIIFHISTQAFSSGLKPETEKYNQNQPLKKSVYYGPFGSAIGSHQISDQESRILKFSINGYTNNLLLNDPVLSMLILVLTPIILILAILLLYKKRKRASKS